MTKNIVDIINFKLLLQILSDESVTFLSKSLQIPRNQLNIVAESKVITIFKITHGSGHSWTYPI